jgi:hypothetical protein
LEKSCSTRYINYSYPCSSDFDYSIAETAETLLQKAEDVITARQEHVDSFIKFDAALPTDLTIAWMRMCKIWEKDRTQENPFRNP